MTVHTVAMDTATARAPALFGGGTGDSRTPLTITHM